MSKRRLFENLDNRKTFRIIISLKIKWIYLYHLLCGKRDRSYKTKKVQFCFATPFILSLHVKCTLFVQSVLYLHKFISINTLNVKYCQLESLFNFRKMERGTAQQFKLQSFMNILKNTLRS